MRHRLCALGDIPEGDSRGFVHPAPDQKARDPRGLFAVRRAARVYVYRNRCPHQGLELNWLPDRFLSREKDLILCSAHGALFDIATGRCVGGPCGGRSLEAVACEVVNGEVWVRL